MGLTFFSPNINIFRDPRWGRGHETYGEDPLLTSAMGVAFVKGLQGDDARHLKLVATAKHYAVHSGPESLRHGFDARVDERDLRLTYLPAFEACVREARVESVMGAYNRTSGEPCCASRTLLGDMLRGEWGFDGYVVSDCGAIGDIYRNHHVVETAAEASAMAVRNGCDLECGNAYAALGDAIGRGLLSEQEIDAAMARLFRARFRLGMFDPPDMVRYAQIPYEVNDCDEHRELAREMARQSIVLLKNDGLLPLRKDLRSIAVIGPNADDQQVLLGNYNGVPSKWVTALDGIRQQAGPRTDVRYARGCGISGGPSAGFAEAVEAASKAEVAVLVLGLHPRLEGEEGDAPDSGASGDRIALGLPRIQERLLRAVCDTGTPVVLVLMNGSAVAVNWADRHVPAIITAWYPGEEGGAAIAEVLFGYHNPAGRLPLTFYRSLAQVPPFDDYRMAGRTYRYFRGRPLYPFGYGLSYTRFSYRSLRLGSRKVQPGQPLSVSAEVENTGDRAGDEVVQLYLRDVAASAPTPIRQLVGFRRIHLAPGEKTAVHFTLSARDMSVIDNAGRRVIEPGRFTVSVGGGQPGARGITRNENILSAGFTVVGDAAELP